MSADQYSTNLIFYIYDWLSKNVPFHDLGVSEILAINRGPNG